MRKEAINTLSEGINYDLAALAVPSNTLTDCVNGSFITFNGDELALQNDAGNTKILVPGTSNQYVHLTSGFNPLGIKEYGGVLYIVSAKLPTSLGEWVNKSYNEGDIVYKIFGDQKIYFKKKITGNHPIPDNTNNFWYLIGPEKEFNNQEGLVEFGSYPSPKMSSHQEWIGDDVDYITSDFGSSDTIQWVLTGISFCEIGTNGKNTGQSMVEYKEMYNPDNTIWRPTGRKKFEKTLDLEWCPIPTQVIGVSVSKTEYNVGEETIIPFVKSINKIETPIKEGTNYLFFSIPKDRNVIFKNSLDQDVSSKFIKVGTDDRPEYVTNDIYRKIDGFNTSISTDFTLIIS